MASASDAPIVIKKVKKVIGGGHHGGAWKVAYADFVTAMMAFFLLMWLINTTSPEQKRGIADYFAPASISQSTSGSGGILGGTALGDDGAKNSGSSSVLEQLAPRTPDSQDPGNTTESLSAASEEALREALAKKEADSFASCAARCWPAVAAWPTSTPTATTRTAASRCAPWIPSAAPAAGTRSASPSPASSAPAWHAPAA